VQFDLFSLVVILIFDVITVLTIYGMCKRFETRLLLLVGVFCFNFSSCLGIILQKENEGYLPSAVAYLLIMTIIMGLIIDGRYKLTWGGRARELINDQHIEESMQLVSGLGVFFFIVVVVSTFYPVNYFSQLSTSSFAITGRRFALSMARSNGLAWMIDRIKLVLLPFFFIWLYRIRSNWKAFILVFVIYSFCDMLQNAMITSRSNYLQVIIFILVYLTLERKISKRQLVIYSAIIAVFGVVLLVRFKDLIMGKSLSYHGLGSYVTALLQSENSGGQARLDFCNSVSGDLDFFHFIYHCLTAPLFFLPDDGFPTLSYYFTTGVLGLSYGQVGYYVILPGALGEGVMILGKYFAWIYGGFFGLYSGAFFRFLRKHNYLRYVYVYFLIQFGLAFRGGMQAFIMRSLNCTFYFMIIIYLIQIVGRGRKRNAVTTDV